MMLGCSPYSYDEESVKMNDPQDYQDWLAEYKEDECIEGSDR